MRGFFITGTDTGVGKTIFSSILLAHAALKFNQVHYHKAINTGIEEDNDAETIRNLIVNPKKQSSSLGIGLKKPLSPHLAAHYQNIIINFTELIIQIKNTCRADLNIIEGAGGLMVPINNKYLIIDLIKELDLPVILVARTSLGTINHTLLSLNALKQKNIKVAAIAMLGHQNRDNERSIAYFGGVKNIIWIPFMTNINSNNVQNIAEIKAAELDAILEFFQ